MPKFRDEDGQMEANGEYDHSAAAEIHDQEMDPAAGEEVVDASFFYDRLSPFGEWLWTAEYGWVWHPGGTWEGWRPYTYGRWVYSS